MASQPTLRSLARAYAAGNLEKEKYRLQRANYLEAVLSGEISVRTTPPAAGRTQQDTTGDATQKKPARSGPADTASTSPFKTIFYLIAAGAILLIVIIAIMMFPGDSDDLVPAQPTATPSAPALTEQTASTAAQDLIKSFLSSNVWSETSMENFLDDWNAIPSTEKSDIRNTTEFSQLSSSIYKKLVEERALSTIGNPETSLEKQRQLVDFARTIGISDPRISLPRQPEPETP